MSVKKIVRVPLYMDIEAIAVNDEGRYMIAFNVGDEEIQFMYLDDFIGDIEMLNVLDDIERLVDMVFGDDDEE